MTASETDLSKVSCSVNVLRQRMRRSNFLILKKEVSDICNDLQTFFLALATVTRVRRNINS